jgi:hypothetical protein
MNRLAELLNKKTILFLLTVVILNSISITSLLADQLYAGAAKVDITKRDGLLVNDTMYVRALVIKNKSTTLVVMSLDVVAIGEIGSVKNSYLPTVRAQLLKEFNINPSNVMANASHCHGVPCADVEGKSIQAVKEALKKMEPVDVGVGSGFEDRVMENRRLKMKNGTEIDVRHAYSLPPDEEVASVGPVDPEIGILRLNKKNGETLAVVYNFAMHPIQGAANGGNTADVTGFSSKVIEENSSEGTIALFVQGCGGDINPVLYKDVDNPRDGEPLGNMLGLSTLKALRKIKCKPTNVLNIVNETIELPRADNAERIESLLTEQRKLLGSLRGTTLNLKTFLPLVVRYNVHKEFPSYYSHRYLHEKDRGRSHLKRHDNLNRQNMERYLKNIYTMEKLTRLQANLNLLKKHQAENIAAGKRTVDVELLGIRIGDFVMTTFPGELTVRIGLNIKKKSPYKPTFVAGYTNGYIYYAPTTEQLRNVGGAQEDSDCILAPEWQPIYEKAAVDILKQL